MVNLMQRFKELNKDQLSSLSKFCLDLAKGAFIYATFSPAAENLAEIFMKIISGFSGIALVITGMLLLQMKKELHEF